MESFTISPIRKLSNDIRSNMSLGTILYTWFFGNFVGSDELSNKYSVEISPIYFDLNNEEEIKEAAKTILDSISAK